MAVLLVVASAAGAQDWTGAGADQLFSNHGNWNAVPAAGASIRFSDIGTSAFNPALVDPAWDITNNSIIVGAGALAGTSGAYAFVDVLRGAKLIGVNLQLGVASVHRPGQLKFRSGSSINTSTVDTGVLTIGRATDGSGVLIVEDGASFNWGALNLQATGVLRYTSGATSLPTFVSGRTTDGGTNTVNGKIEVDLLSLMRDETGQKEYTLIANAYTT